LTDVRKVDLLIEVGQFVRARSSRDLVGLAVVSSIAGGSVPISLVQKLLVVTFQLVVEDHAIHADATFFQALRLTKVRPIELRVVLELARLPDAGVESLPWARRVVPSCGLEQFLPAICQSDGNVATALQSDDIDEALLSQVAEVATTGIGRTIAVVTEVGGGHDPERTDARQDAAFRTAEAVLALPVPDDLSLRTARQIEISGKHIGRV
jgi:hypothetical protein